METIGTQELWSFLHNKTEAIESDVNKIRNGRGHRVQCFLELATKVAELQYRNRDYVLLFRGQIADYRNNRNNNYSTLQPTLMRPIQKGIPNQRRIKKRFAMLRKAESKLELYYKKANFLDIDRLKRHRILRWAILQHYEVCPTPLLDVTSSLRIAASFASYKHDGQGFVFVIGVPNLSGGITGSAEAGLQIVRLASACPPAALRPHFQEGYLLGEYPEMGNLFQRANYKSYEIDFSRRLVAKFCFNPKTFWEDKNFPKVSPKALRPSEDQDPFLKLTLKVKNYIKDL